MQWKCSDRMNLEKRITNFPVELDLGEINQVRPERKKNVAHENNEPKYGYCIRTGKKIKFNPKYPLCKEAWQSWNQFKNGD